MPTTLSYGAWPSPITAELITGRVVGLASPWLDGEDAYWTESRPLEGGRTTLIRRGPDGTALRADARAVQPAHPRARIWRPPVHRAGRDCRRCGADGPAHPSPDDRCGAVGTYARDRRPAALRRPGSRPAAPASAGGARGPSRGRRADQHAGGGADRRRPARRRGAGIGPRLLRLSAPQPGRQPAGLAELGPPRHALGPDHALARRTGRDRAARGAGGDRDRRGGESRSSPNGRRMGSCTSCPTAATSGASIASTVWALSPWRCWRPSSLARSGSWARAGTTSSTSGRR